MKRFIIIIIVILIPGVVFAAKPCERATVVKVSDGDTVKVVCNGDKLTIRLIGIDTPETHRPNTPVQCYGREASQYLKQRLEGKRIRLKYDVERMDKYGRTLAYVYRGGTFINAEMIKKGYAFAYRRYYHKYKDKFIGYEEKAKRKGRGLWGACKIKCNGSICHTSSYTSEVSRSPKGK